MVERCKRHSIFAMSRVGYTSTDRLEIIIYTDDPGKVPHLHFQNLEGVDGCLRLDKAQYFPHGRHRSKLNTKQMRALVKFMKQPYRERGITNWEHTIDLWNDNNSDVVLPDDTPMPDYIHMED